MPSPNVNSRAPEIQWRRLRGYAFDPGLSQQFETVGINEIVFRLPWERVEPGPAGEYVEVIDCDPASGAFYAPVNLDDPTNVGNDGLSPDESDPKFHQQFVYAVTMLTIYNFEKALGRRVLWNIYDKDRPTGNRDVFIRRLRIYPHAFRGANAYYSRQKMALLFGYFPASADARGAQLPGGLIFTCLSHDIVAHETTHALLDATLPKCLDATNRDMLAFHEAFADIVALFQHFSFPEVLRHQIAQTRGDLASQSLLGQLAQQFGQSTGLYGGLREAIGRHNENGKWEKLPPDPRAYDTLDEPHARGALLVAAVFDAFLAIYRARVADLVRLATGGTGVLHEGALPPDLTERLTREASKTARHVLGMCIRALDYCPPVDLTFGDYLRAIITADFDLVPDDVYHYRVAFVEAFRKWGLYPRELRTLSTNAVRWPRGEDLDESARQAVGHISKKLRDLGDDIRFLKDREQQFKHLAEVREKIHVILRNKDDESLLGNFEEVTGLLFDPKHAVPGITTQPNGTPRFQVHSLRPVRRRGPNGEEINHVVLAITQRRELKIAGDSVDMHGGCTLILDLDTLELRYAIRKPIADTEREADFRKFMGDNPTALALAGLAEPVAHLHLHA